MKHYLIAAILGAFAFGSQAFAGDENKTRNPAENVQVPASVMAKIVPDMTKGDQGDRFNVEVPDWVMAKVLPELDGERPITGTAGF